MERESAKGGAKTLVFPSLTAHIFAGAFDLREGMAGIADGGSAVQLALGKHVAAILKDYERQKAAGIEEPKFVAAEAGLPAGTVTDWWGA